MNNPLINTTGRAIVALSILGFAVACITYLLCYGEPTNSLHQSALSWSYMLIIFMALALGIDSAAANWIMSAYSGKPPTPPAPTPTP
jgi:hypothetical protein